eukprot:425105_1
MQNNGNACQGVVMCIGYPFARRSMRYGINLFHANGDHDGSLTIDIIKTGKLWARISMHFCLILQISRRFGCGVCSKYSFNTGLVSEMHWTQKRDTERAIELIFENKHLLEQMELFESLKGIHCFIYWANLNRFISILFWTLKLGTSVVVIGLCAMHSTYIHGRHPMGNNVLCLCVYVLFK